MILSQFLDHDFLKLPRIDDHFKNSLSNKKIIITGATGVIGKWLLYYLIFIRKYFNVDFEVLATSRNPQSFLDSHPEIRANTFISWKQCNLAGTINYNFSPDMIIHMATDVSKTRKDSTSSSLMEIIVSMDNLLNLAKSNTHKKVKMLYLSSGAIYGEQPTNIQFISEHQQGCLNPLASTDFYCESKRICESMGSIAAKNYSNFEFVSARCFALSGPFIPLNSSYALGNFVDNLLKHKNIEINGSGNDKRSYLYGADLANWLVTILIKGKNGDAYNVGSEDVFTIKELADNVARFDSGIKVNILKKDAKFNVYIPSNEKARLELNLRNNFSLQYSIERMIKFYQEFY